MDKAQKTDLLIRIAEATAKSPSLGNIPGNIDEQIANHKKYTTEIVKFVSGIIDGIKS